MHDNNWKLSLLKLNVRLFYLIPTFVAFYIVKTETCKCRKPRLGIKLVKGYSGEMCLLKYIDIPNYQLHILFTYIWTCPCGACRIMDCGMGTALGTAHLIAAFEEEQKVF